MVDYLMFWELDLELNLFLLLLHRLLVHRHQLLFFSDLVDYFLL